MRPSLPVLTLVLAAAIPQGVAAQTERDDLMDEPPGLFRRGAEMFLKDLLDQAEPTLDELERTWREFAPEIEKIGPMVESLVTMVEDIRNYELPARMPNGDILIRRKPNAPALPVLPDEPGLRDPIPPAPHDEDRRDDHDVPDLGPAPEIEL